jgi:hypothetical protein
MILSFFEFFFSTISLISLQYMRIYSGVVQLSHTVICSWICSHRSGFDIVINNNDKMPIGTKITIASRRTRIMDFNIFPAAAKMLHSAGLVVGG